MRVCFAYLRASTCTALSLTSPHLPRPPPQLLQSRVDGTHVDKSPSPPLTDNSILGRVARLREVGPHMA